MKRNTKFAKAMAVKNREYKKAISDAAEATRNISLTSAINWDEVCGPEIDSDSGGGGSSLGSPHPSADTVVRPPPRIWLEITLSMPRKNKNGTPSMFAKASSREQREIYEANFKRLVNYRLFDEAVDREADYEIEFNQDGQTHMHGYIEYYNVPTHYSLGVVCDIAKYFCKANIRQYDSNYLHPQYNRYKSPAITVQYFFSGDSEEKYAEEKTRWQEYMKKEPYNK